jgi:hypothetical protein
MPAPRACRTCGGDLLPSVRWCSRCLEPVREFSPRHYEGFQVAEGHHLDSDPAGHWSRWEKSATTMGPRGRVGATAAIALWLVCGFFFEFLLTWLCQLVLLSWVLVGVWRKGWAIPDAPDQQLLRLTPEERRSLLPHYSDWRDATPRTKVLLILSVVLAAAFWRVWSTGDQTRQGVMAICLSIAIGVPVLYKLAKPM